MNIVVIGCGTTGNAIIPLLKGVLLLIDRDIVEERNISRQKLFSKKDIGKPKAEILGKKFHCRYKIVDLDYTTVSLLDADLVIDCTDNLETRFLINEYCHKKNIPWIYTAAVGSRTRMMAFTGDACFRCLFSEVKGLETCATAGVDPSRVEILAKKVKEESKRIVLKKKTRGLWADDTWYTVKRNPHCSVCKGVYSYLHGKREAIIKFCGSSRYQVKGNINFSLLKKRFHGRGEWFVHDDFYIFRDRIMVNAESEREAKKKVAEIIGS